MNITNTGENFSHAMTTEWHSHAATTGHYAHAMTAGHNSHAVTTGVHSNAVTADIGSHAMTTGWDSHAMTTRWGSHAVTTGGSSHAVTAGSDGIASVYGANSIAIAIGADSRVKGVLGSALVCAEYEYDEDIRLISIKAGIVDGETLMPETWYTVSGGEWVEAELTATEQTDDFDTKMVAQALAIKSRMFYSDERDIDDERELIKLADVPGMLDEFEELIAAEDSRSDDLVRRAVDVLCVKVNGWLYR